MSCKLLMLMPDGSSSELQVYTSSYSATYQPIRSIGSHEVIGHEPPTLEFTITGRMTVGQMAEMRKADYTSRGFANRLEPHDWIKKKTLDERRAELLQQLLDTFKEPKNGKD